MTGINSSSVGAGNQLTIVRELSVVYRGKRKLDQTVSSPEIAASFARSILPNDTQEHFFVLGLDGQNKICSYWIAHTGTQNACMVRPADVFRPAVMSGCLGIIVGHNHPSGNLIPSDVDLKATENLKQAADLIQIKLLDSLLITEDSFKSLLN